MHRGLAFAAWLALASWLFGLPWFAPWANKQFGQCTALPWELRCGDGQTPFFAPEFLGVSGPRPTVTCGQRPLDSVCASGAFDAEAPLPAWCPEGAAPFNEPLCPTTGTEFSISYFLCSASAASQMGALTLLPWLAVVDAFQGNAKLCVAFAAICWHFMLALPICLFHTAHVAAAAGLYLAVVSGSSLHLWYDSSCFAAWIEASLAGLGAGLPVLGYLATAYLDFKAPVWVFYHAEAAGLVIYFSLPWLCVMSSSQTKSASGEQRAMSLKRPRDTASACRPRCAAASAA